jgi:hypothetical protein
MPQTVGVEPSTSDTSFVPLIPAWQLRRLAQHNCGLWQLPVTCAGFPPYGNYSGSYRDPETGQLMGYGGFPSENTGQFIFASGIWIGGIVNGDTLVSTAYDTWYGGIFEFWPPDPEQGGLYRSGDFADDEFVAVYTDTVTGSYADGYNPYDDTSHIPLGLKLTQQSYSWSDTLYDNFVIIEFVIENIGDNFIEEGWFGIIMDPDIYLPGGNNAVNGWADDVSGIIDTLLYDGDSSSRVVIPYSIDMDGDPGIDGEWDEDAVTGAVSIALLEAPVTDPIINFNWWVTDNISQRDFGPRRLGTPEDPFRTFSGEFLGTAHRQEDKFYLMAHPEVDYNHIETDIHDSATGWIPAQISILSMLNDTKFLYSFGPFDLAPNDTARVALAIVASEGIHVSPGDFAEYFDPENPEEYESRLDFSEMMLNHRRADSVYRSGFQLPTPGPPVGLRAVEYDYDQVTLTWNASKNPALVGYYVNVKDTVYDNIWRRAHIHPLADTVYTFSVSNPLHLHLFGISSIDNQGRESENSFELGIIPATPKPPCDLTAELDGLIPVLNWLPYNDTTLQVYMIYRSSWKGAYTLYDSVSALQYRDYGIESGVRYNYMVSARNDWLHESEPTGPVSAMPMALNQGVLFYDLNYDDGAHLGPYHRRYVDRLIYSIQPSISVDYHDKEVSDLPFKKMSLYSLIIFDSEMRGGKFYQPSIDSIRNYLSSGGKALFISPNASTRDIGMSAALSIYGDGSFFHDLLHLDSAATNQIVFLDDSIRGDLMGCRSLSPQYPDLAADLNKMVSPTIPVAGYIPLSGYIYPDNNVELLYRYQSLYSDSTYHDQINGIKYTGADYSFVMFNFPLSLMEAPENVIAFRQALTDLGIDLTCGDINDNQFVDVGDAVILLAFLFQEGPEPADLARADVDCNGAVDLADVMIIINAIFFDGNGLSCCPR